MSLGLREAAVIALLATGVCHGVVAGAQQLSVLGGTSEAQHSDDLTYAWQLDLQQNFDRYMAMSLAWLNEGHFPGHWRDGAAVQGWVQDAPWDHLTFGLGFGPYLYFDTEPQFDSRGYANHHGVALLLTPALTMRTSNRWTFQLRWNVIRPSGDVAAQSWMLGAGYRLEPRQMTPAGDGGAPQGSFANEIQALTGRQTLNSLQLRERAVYGLDYQRRFQSWLGAGATWLQSTTGSSRTRAAVQLRIEHGFSRIPFAVEAGIGPYSILSTGGAVRLEGLMLLRMSWQLSAHASVVANWFRSFTEDDTDSDIIAAGLSWGF